MNKVKVQQLLDRWNTLLEIGEQASRGKASKSQDGLDGRIKRTIGTPVIFDSDTFGSQNDLQASLCQEIPQFADLIHSKPEIMDGYQWTRGDFIELYFEHFRLVIEKLRRLTDQPSDM